MTEEDITKLVERYKSLHAEMDELSSKDSCGEWKTDSDIIRYQDAMNEFLYIGKIITAYYDAKKSYMEYLAGMPE